MADPITILANLVERVQRLELGASMTPLTKNRRRRTQRIDPDSAAILKYLGTPTQRSTAEREEERAILAYLTTPNRSQHRRTR